MVFGERAFVQQDSTSPITNDDKDGAVTHATAMCFEFRHRSNRDIIGVDQNKLIGIGIDTRPRTAAGASRAAIRM